MSRKCKKGKPCGASCIAEDRKCVKPPPGGELLLIVKDAVELCVSLRRRQKRSEAFVLELETAGNSFIEAGYGKHLVQEITGENVESWLNQGGRDVRTFNKDLESLKSIFDWVKQSVGLKKNPCDEVKKKSEVKGAKSKKETLPSDKDSFEAKEDRPGEVLFQGAPKLDPGKVGMRAGPGIQPSAPQPFEGKGVKRMSKKGE
jgi:hypothetical protein